MSFLEVTAFLFDGFKISLLIFAVTLLCGAPLGLPIAFCSMSRFKVIKSITKVIVWIVRGIPLMLQIFIIYYVPGLLFDYQLFGQIDRFMFIEYGIADAVTSDAHAFTEYESFAKAHTFVQKKYGKEAAERLFWSGVNNLILKES